MSPSRPAAPASAIASSRAVRVRAVIGAVACLALGLGLQLLDRSLVIDLLGSALYVVFAGLLALLIRPSLTGPAVALIAVAFATVIELLQLTGIPAAIVDVVPLARLVFGSSFDPMDLVAYLVGAVLLVPIVAVIRRRGSAPEGGDGSVTQKTSTPAR
ncbi:DUF2809 domain-containing protein [Agromyces sp. NPDC057865]|uniref:ribosomal maturation YjgA family protein n=1 Tax=Agromyces sp. NPDC057865 TaxID=3346267 RepID=UPI00366D8445